ncbi:MAG: prepilin-type N-terminal cleavage/methylation domain-containing protein [Candidatus Doudnabacteria bacterium]
MRNRNKNYRQSGQTLIETIVAIFILTTALTAGLGLAIYAFSSATTSQNEIVASNLAREGVEIVRMMRDSNWLAADAKDPTSVQGWGLQSCADLIGGRLCYPKVYQAVPGYNTYNLTSGNQRAIFAPNPTTSTWSLDATANYDLYLQADGTYSSTANGQAVFARMINIRFNPPDAGTPSVPANTYTFQNPEMIVKSVVAWRGKSCPSFSSNQDLLALSSSCKVVVEEHMTNWKDYR